MTAPSSPCLLHLSKTSWRLIDAASENGQSETTLFDENSLDEQASLIFQALEESDRSGRPIVVGLASTWCLAATIELPSSYMLRKPQMMHCHLEDWIPWSAEEYVSDFIGHRSHAFSVAVRHRELALLLHALDSQGVKIVAVVPTALLSVAELTSQERLPSHYQLLWQCDDVIDLFVMKDSLPWKWIHLRARPAEITRCLQHESLVQTSPPPLFTLGLCSELGEAIDESGYEFVQLNDACQLTAASRAGNAVVTGKAEPLLNLRQGELAGKHRHQTLRKELTRLKLAAALLVFCLGGAFWWWSEQSSQAMTEVNGQLLEVYHELFSANDKIIADDVQLAIEDEHKLLLGTRALAADLPSPAAADRILENLLRSLPTDLRFRLPEIRVEQDRVTLGGEVRTNADADRIASALRSNGFSVDAPRLQRLADQGFSVRLNARAQANSTKGQGEQP